MFVLVFWMHDGGDGHVEVVRGGRGDGGGGRGVVMVPVIVVII